MYIVRETFTARPGKASALAKLLKQVMSQMTTLKTRVLTDYIADFNTVVVEVESEDLAAFDRTMAEYATRTDIHELMKGYTDMYVTGKREVYRVV
jgi:excinuclease UvrABC nuclease subunit